MAVTVVRYTTRPERADENQALVEKVFGELALRRPDGLRYATFRLEDGVTFVHVVSVDTEDGSNPLGATVAFGVFAAGDRRSVRGRAAGDRACQVVGSYGFGFDGTGQAAGG